MRVAVHVLVAALAVLWVLELRPGILGGPASYVRVAGSSMEPGLRTGDVIVTRRRASYEIGDVVAYRVPAGDPGEGHVVIHRIVGGDGRAGYLLRGDNRTETDLWRPRDRDVLGEQRVRLPGLAWLASLVLSPPGLGLLAAFAAFTLVAVPPPGPASARTPRRSRAARGSTDASPGGTA